MELCSPPGSAAPSAPVSAPVRCALPNLTVTAGSPDASAGHRAVVLTFTNTATVPCTMRGYPGVALLDGHATQVAQARRTPHGYEGGVQGEAPAVTLAPGRSASAIVEALAANTDGTACVPWSGLLVTAPDERRSTRLGWDSDGCADPQVHPVVPGTTGRLG
ncbi:DUF4232 domain-containing protein [Dactylosporangium sp. NPDC051541]|uniref:DUF4232 domain-containing protein n=1 Tax=Dactylosporangium sp. NPDC051541 TaxID=3363977 RepID=UPI0037B4DBEE